MKPPEDSIFRENIIILEQELLSIKNKNAALALG